MDRVERIFRQAGAVLEGHFLLTTGGSLGQVAEAVGRAGGRVVGLAVILDRRPVPSGTGRTLPLVIGGLPVFASHRSPVASYPPEECPQCRALLGRVPLERLGGKR